MKVNKPIQNDLRARQKLTSEYLDAVEHILEHTPLDAASTQRVAEILLEGDIPLRVLQETKQHAYNLCYHLVKQGLPYAYAHAVAALVHLTVRGTTLVYIEYILCTYLEQYNKHYASTQKPQQ